MKSFNIVLSLPPSLPPSPFLSLPLPLSPSPSLSLSLLMNDIDICVHMWMQQLSTAHLPRYCVQRRSTVLHHWWCVNSTPSCSVLQSCLKWGGSWRIWMDRWVSQCFSFISRWMYQPQLWILCLRAFAPFGSFFFVLCCTSNWFDLSFHSET